MTVESGVSGPTSSALKLTVAAAVFVGLIVGLSVVSNTLLDHAGIADGPGFTVEQRKAKARRNQLEWDQRIRHEQ
jgi:hypothetical protein